MRPTFPKNVLTLSKIVDESKPLPWGLRSSVRIPAGVWSHIAVTYGTGMSKIFINGTLRGSQAEGGVSEAWASTRPRFGST
jgi:hypothetical protein